MDQITIHSVGTLKESCYVKPQQVTYTQGGCERRWDYIRVHDSVAILIFNKTINCIVMVKQFRPAVYMHECHKRHDVLAKTGDKITLEEISKEVPAQQGVMYELCAGIVDKVDKCKADIAVMEVQEETGYTVSAENLEIISNFRSGIGTSGSVQTMYYVEVTDDMKTHKGGGLESEGEIIEPFLLPINEVEEFVNNKDAQNRPSGVLLGLMWFLRHKYHLYQ